MKKLFVNNYDYPLLFMPEKYSKILKNWIKFQEVDWSEKLPECKYFKSFGKATTK